MTASIQVTVDNILLVAPLELALWVSENILNITLPTYGLNYTPNIKNDILPLLPLIGNRINLVTSLHNICVGAKAHTMTMKRSSDLAEKENATIQNTTLVANVDILYRTIQALESTHKTASRLMTGLSEEYAQL